MIALVSCQTTQSNCLWLPPAPTIHTTVLQQMLPALLYLGPLGTQNTRSCHLPLRFTYSWGKKTHMCLRTRWTRIQDSWVQRPWIRFKPGFQKKAHNPGGSGVTQWNNHLRCLKQGSSKQRNDSTHSTEGKEAGETKDGMGRGDRQEAGRPVKNYLKQPPYLYPLVLTNPELPVPLVIFQKQCD